MLRESGSASAARASSVAAAAGCPSPSRAESPAVPLVDAAVGRVLLRHEPSPFPGRVPPRRGGARPAAWTLAPAPPSRALLRSLSCPRRRNSARPLAASGLEVRPFRALTYRRRDPGHLARVSSPAYDLVTPAGRDRLADADPHNVVRLILPRCAAGPDAEHRPGPAGRPDAGELAGGRGARSRPRACPVALRTAAARRRAGDHRLARRGRPAAGRVGGGPPARGHLPACGRGPPEAACRHGHRPRAHRAGPRPGADGRRTHPHRPSRRRDPPAGGFRRCRAPALAGDRPGHRPADSPPPSGRRARSSPTATTASRPPGRTPAPHRPQPGSDAVLALVTPMGPGGLRVAPIHRVVPDLALDDALSGRAPTVSRSPSCRWPAAAGRRSWTAVRRWLAAPTESGFLVTDGRRLHRAHAPLDAVLAAVPTEAPAGVARPGRRPRPSRSAGRDSGSAATTRSRSSSLTATEEAVRTGSRTSRRGAAAARAVARRRRRRGARRGTDATEVDPVRARTTHRPRPPTADATDRPEQRHALRSAALPAERGTFRPRRQFTSQTDAVPVRSARTVAAGHPRPRPRHPAARAPFAAAVPGRR